MIRFNFRILLPLIFLSASCAILQPVKIETPGNPSPITKENEMSLRSLRSIAVVPFIEGKERLKKIVITSQKLSTKTI